VVDHQARNGETRVSCDNYVALLRKMRRRSRSKNNLVLDPEKSNNGESHPHFAFPQFSGSNPTYSNIRDGACGGGGGGEDLCLKRVRTC